MKKIILLATMLLVVSMTAFAQDKYPKFELAGTYTMVRYDIQILGNESIHGYGISAQYNANKVFGVVGEWTATHGKSGPYSLAQGGRIYQIPEVDTRFQTLMFGPRISGRTKPVTVFGHWLVGAATNKLDDDIGAYNYNSFTKWQFAMAIGGGVDINVSKSVAIRAAQFDWVPVHSSLDEVSSSTKTFWNNVRYQAGVVFKF
jgi:opacity protein-like surface antigen